jgi:formylglycine-generating enzyme required for sulfatase activity
MIVVPDGSFTMGAPPVISNEKEEAYNGESPQHEVTIAKPFAVSRFEVTFDDWDVCVAYGACPPAKISDSDSDLCVGNGDCPRAKSSDFGRGPRPLIKVTWGEAKGYVAWLSSMTGRTYRLLSEAEWEYAARAGTQTAYSFGEEKALAGEYAWYEANADFQAHPVGEKGANKFGLYDMHGNVEEWVEDCDHDDYNDAPADGSAWMGAGNCYSRMVRGGGWGDTLWAIRSAYRTSHNVDDRSEYVGFRVARTLSE